MKSSQFLLGAILSLSFASSGLAAGVCQVNYEYLTPTGFLSDPNRTSLPVRTLDSADSFGVCLSESVRAFKYHFGQGRTDKPKMDESISSSYSPLMVVTQGSAQAQYGGRLESSRVTLESRPSILGRYCSGEALDPSTARGTGNIVLNNNNPHEVYYIQIPVTSEQVQYPATLNECIARVVSVYQIDRKAGKNVGSRLSIEYRGPIDDIANSPLVKAKLVTNIENQ